MTSVATRSFRSGNSEAVRLPKAIAYGRDIELIAERRGDVVTLRPVNDPAEGRRRVAELIAAMDAIGPVGEIGEREPIEFPYRPGIDD